MGSSSPIDSTSASGGDADPSPAQSAGQAAELGTPAGLGQALSQPDDKDSTESGSFGMTGALSRQILESLPDGVIGIDEARQMAFLNTAAAQLLGISREEWHGQPFSRLVSAEKMEQLNLSAHLAHSGQGKIFTRTDGSTFDAEWQVTPVSEPPHFQGCLLLFRDISYLRQMEMVVHESRSRFNRAFYDPAIGKAFLSLDGRFLQVNPYFCQLLGYESHDIVGTYFWELTHPDDVHLGRAGLVTLLSGEAEAVHCDKRYLHRNGSSIKLSLTGSMIRDEDGQPMYVMIQLQDKTHLADMEQALRQSQERFRRAFEEAAIGMAIVSLEQNYLEINPRFCEMLGYAQASLEGQSALAFAHPEDLALEARFTQRMLQGELETCAYEKRYLHRDGQIVWAHVTASNVRDESGALLYFVRQVQDITDRKLADQQIRKAREEAEATAALKAEFLAIVSHEVRTPMNAVLGMASLLSATSLTPQQRQLVETIQNSGNTLMALMNDILDYSKIESGKMELDLHPFALASCLDKACAMFRPRALEKGLSLELTIAEDLPAVVLGDSNRLVQIMVNLIGNAVKFTDQGRVTVRARLAETPCPDNLPGHLNITFQVQDTGCGIPQDKLQVIFDSFTQAAPTTSRHYGGSGLGLAICTRLVQLMQGQISVESVLGEGSTFSFTVPLSRVDESLRTAKLTDQPVPPTFDASLADRAPLRILVAEDNRVNQQLMLNILEGLGYAVTMVSDGLAVLVALEDGAFDLIFMDIQMPLLDGLETSRIINQRYGQENRPRIIAITAFGLQEDRRMCLAAGMDDYLAKPIQIGQLELLLEYWYQWLQNRDSLPVPESPHAPPDAEFSAEALVNTRELLAYLGGQPAQLREMVDVFAEESAELLTGLWEALANQSEEALLRHLHQLKGACLALRLDGLKQQVAQLEKVVKTQGLSSFAPELEPLQAEVQRALAELNQLLRAIYQPDHA